MVDLCSEGLLAITTSYLYVTGMLSGADQYNNQLSGVRLRKVCKTHIFILSVQK